MADMIDLDTGQKIHVGKRILEAVNCPDKMAELMADPKAYFGFGTELPDTEQTIVVHQNRANETHIMIPFEGFIPEHGTYSHPPAYDSANGGFINPVTEPDDAYHFRVGDYVFAQCG